MRVEESVDELVLAVLGYLLQNLGKELLLEERIRVKQQFLKTVRVVLDSVLIEELPLP